MAISFLLVENCCFYIPLASGVKFFGFLSLSGCILLLIIGCLDLFHISRWAEYEEPMTEEVVLVAIDLTAQIIQSSTATLLLLGVYQRKPKLIPYWLFTTPVSALLELTILRNVAFHFFYIRYYQLDWFILNSITMIDDVYGWVVAYSYYHSLLTPEAAAV